MPGPEPKRTIPSRSLNRWLCFAVITTALVLAISECGLRLVSTALRHVFVESGGDADTCRSITLVCLGDSMTFGLGATPGESYPMRLQEMMREDLGIRTKVYNLGIPGSNTSEGILHLRHFFREHPGVAPDFFFILYGVNNRWNLHEATLWDNDRSAKKSHLLAYLTSHFHLSKAVRVAMQGAEEAATKQRSGLEYRRILDERGWSVFFSHFDEPSLAGWIENDLRTMFDLARQKDASPVVLSYFDPHFPELNPLLLRIAERSGVPAIHLERPEAYYRTATYYAEDWFHLNARGYRDVAARIYRQFVQQWDKPALERRLQEKSTQGVCAPSQ